MREGDEYVVNGSKIWTSSAHHADWIFALVRTDPEAAKQQQGISFLLIDMTTPGIEVSPIVAMDGGHYLNQVFFTDVRVPASNRVGEENKGWTYAKFLLGNERTGIAGVSKSRMKVERLKEIAAVETGTEEGRLGEDAAFRARLGEIEARLGALEIVNLRTLAAEEKGKAAGPEASILKICGTEIEQALNEMLIESVGVDAIPYSLEWTRLDTNEDPPIADRAVGLMSEHLLKRAATIYGRVERNPAQYRRQARAGALSAMAVVHHGSHWGAFRAETAGGRVTGALPFAKDPEPSPIAASIPDAVHHASRIAGPMARRGWLDGDGGKGRGRDAYVPLDLGPGGRSYRGRGRARRPRLRQCLDIRRLLRLGERRALPPCEKPVAALPRHGGRLHRPAAQLQLCRRPCGPAAYPRRGGGSGRPGHRLAVHRRTYRA